MESPTHSLMDAALKCLPVMLPVLDFSTVKNDVFPPIATVFSRTGSLAIKVRGLEAFVVLCGGSAGNQAGSGDDLSGITHESRSPKPSATSILDKYTVQEKVVPLLRATKTKEPAVMMAALDVFRQVGQIADAEFLALEVLPIMWRFSLGPLLNLQQFGSYMELIKSLSMRVEREQTRKLQELASTNETTNFNNSASSPSGVMNDLGVGSNGGDVKSDFERLVLGRPGDPKPSDDQWDDWNSAPTSSNNVSKGVTSPTFSWSSNANRSNADRPGAVASLSTQNSRSITPDRNMSTFPTLEPASTQRSSMGPSFSSSHRHTTSASGTNSFGAQSTSGSSTSLAALASMRSQNMPSTNQPQQNLNSSSFSIAPPPSSNSQSNASGSPYGGLSSQGQNQANSSLPQWNPNTKNVAFQNGTSAQSTTQGKQGLEKYESLL